MNQFGAERVLYVLANTIQQKEWDGRFTYPNKEWAKTVSIRPIWILSAWTGTMRLQ